MPACCESSESFLGKDAAQAVPAPQKWLRFALALVLAGLSMQFSLGVNISPVAGHTRLLIHGALAFTAILVLVLLGGPVLRRSWDAARQRQITLEQLFLLGITGALAASLHSSLTGTGAIFYEVVGVLVAVYTFGQMLVERQRNKVRSSLQALTDSLRTAVLLTCCGKRRVVPLSELEPGDRVLVEKGQRLPVDGTIAEGRAYVQEIAHTGEPFPAAKTIGDAVLAGTVALDGDLIISVSTGASVRELDRLAARLETGLHQRSGWLREADRWMTWFVPVVAFVAAGTFGFWLWRATWEVALFNGVAVLLVACPCGLGLGIPIALWHTMHRLARFGIVADGSELIERLARVRTVIFDKTGTLTEETLQLHALRTVEGIDAATLRTRLALIESHCDHPVARPFSALLGELPGAHARLVDLRTLPGQGVAARLADATGNTAEMVIGNTTLTLAQHQSALAELRRQSGENAGVHRELFIFENDRLIALALLSETVRPAMATLAPRLRTLGLQPGIMTGDASPNLQQWAGASVPIASAMTAADKASAVQAMEHRGEAVLFVGDGLNDAEAMASATASLAVTGGDTTARAQAHGELSGPALGALPEAIAASRATHSTVRLILAISLTYNIIGVLLAASGHLHPIAAAAIMFASSLTVVAVAARRTGSADQEPASATL
jgi:P-type Cu+ transporter